MPFDSAHFRERAAHCRELAKGARDDQTIAYLLEMAADLDEEADRLECEESE